MTSDTLPRGTDKICGRRARFRPRPGDAAATSQEDARVDPIVSVPELAFVAATRGMAGAGLALLLSDYLKSDQRRAAGWTLLGIGLLTTIPIAATVFGRRRQQLLPQ